MPVPREAFGLDQVYLLHGETYGKTDNQIHQFYNRLRIHLLNLNKNKYINISNPYPEYSFQQVQVSQDHGNTNYPIYQEE
jgi:hypothetical protein